MEQKNEILRALQAGEFSLDYQPIWDLRADRLCGAEALLRWKHPRNGFVPPADFIPAAELTGAIDALGEFALTRACLAAAAWAKQGYDLTISVNVSGVQLRTALHKTVDRVLQKTGLEPRLLELELTESVFVSSPAAILEEIKTLRALGVRLSIDDFGTGYSCLSYLKELPVTAVKLGQSFVQGAEKCLEDRYISQHVIQLCKQLGMEVLAEGVETDFQAWWYSTNGAARGQGYFFGRPQTLEDFFQANLAPHPGDCISRQETLRSGAA